MDKYLFNSYTTYFKALGRLGYVKDKSVQSLLIMTFIYRLVFFDYRGKINEEDYHAIEKAINCLYGTNCLLPYRDYLKMGKLHIGEYTELAHKLACLREDYDDTAEKVGTLDERLTRVDGNNDNPDNPEGDWILAQHRKTINSHTDTLSSHTTTIGDHEKAITNHADEIDKLKTTEVMKNESKVAEVEDIVLTI